MRILFVSNNYTPYSGGVVSSINSTIRELQAQGHQVQLITLNFLGNHAHDPSWVRRIPSLFRFRFKNNYMAIPWRPHFYLIQWMREFKPDIVHAHHPFLLGSQAISIAHQLGIKKVFTYHTMYQAYAHYVPLPRWITQRIIKKLVTSFCKKVDHIIAPSHGIKAMVATETNVPITVIPSAVQSFFLQQPFIKKELTKPYQLLYVGRLVKEKNIPVLLDVMAQLPREYHLTLVGYGEYMDYLQKYAYDVHHLSPDQVRFVIKPPQATLLALYCQAHLLLFPSHTDTQGLVLAEAMACSTPVIALDGMGQRDIIKQGTNGCIVENEAQMKIAITAVMHDRATYETLQRGAYTTAQVYRPERLIDALIKVYEQTLFG